jgi:hypothetical protein
MTVEEVLMEKVKVLPPSRKQEVLDFVEFIESREAKSENVKEFHIRSKRMGFRKDLDYDNIGELLEHIEDAAK